MLAAILLLALPAQPCADEALDEDLQAIHRLIELDRWKPARTALLELLESHRDEVELRARWFELAELLTRISFWIEHPPPEPGDVIAGDLVSYSESSGKAKIKYSREHGKLPWDFQVYDNVWIHPALFAGPYTLRVKGEASWRTPALLAACFDEDSAFVARFDGSRGSSLVSVDGGRTEQLDFATDMIRGDRWFEVDVRDTKITFRNNGKTIVSAKKPKDRWGRAGFYYFSKVELCEISGKLETSWIEGRMDAMVRAARTSFDARFDPLEHVPDWLVEDLGTYEAPPLRSPGESHPYDQENLDWLSEALSEGNYDDLVAHAEELPASKVDPTLRELMLAFGERGRGNGPQALRHLERVLAKAPDHLLACYLEAQLRFLLDPGEETLAHLETFSQRFAARPEPLVLLAQAHYLLGDLEAALEPIVQEIADGTSPFAFEAFLTQLSKARLGPSWAKTYERRTKHFVIRSDLDEDICFEASKILEDSYRKWNLHLRAVDQPPEHRYRVFLFSGYRGYLDYGGDVLGSAENSWGVFSPSLDQLLVWNAPEREAMLETIRHEGFHQYLDALIPSMAAPKWLNEGLAEYYSNTELVRGRWRDGALHREHLAHLARGWNLSVRALVEMNGAEFMADPAATYAMSWALCHFLMSDSDRRKRLDGFLDALVGGASAAQAQPRLGDLDVLDREFRAYVSELFD